RRTRGLVSRNLIIKGVLQLLIVVINSFCGELIANMNPPHFSIQQAREKASQLIKAIRTRQEYVTRDLELFTFTNIFNPKDQRDLVSNRRTLPYATYDREKLAEYSLPVH